jgi:hypothetical protein
MVDRIDPTDSNHRRAVGTGSSTSVSSMPYPGATALMLPKLPAQGFAVAIKNDSVTGTTLNVWGHHLQQMDNLVPGGPKTIAPGATNTFTYQAASNKWTIT